MRAIKYLVPLWTAILFYAFSSIAVGAVGMGAYKQLLVQHEQQLANLQSLQEKTEELSGIQEALRYDYDTIVVYARDMGFGTSDEKFIRIVGLNGKHKELPDAGEVVSRGELDYVDDKTLRIISVIIAVSMMVCIAIVDVLRFIKNA
ncbi:MAG: hypothetical protein Ta2B_12860 [Termitinemataceae bacterium]|nr:MAG: hypothetical protein Ta2B_12860 [Termitinemataceae bacterium]